MKFIKMSIIIDGMLLICLLLPMCASAKQIRFPEHIEAVHQFPGQPIPSSEYPVYRGSPGQDLSSESVGIEFEDGIIRSMLTIVDGKFNTLSTRMTSLERGINSLQVYLSRQFRHVTKNLQAVNIVMNSLHAEVSHVDMETRSVRNSILALNKEFLDYRNTNLGVFREYARVGQRTLPVDTVVDSNIKSKQSLRTERKEIDIEFSSEQPSSLNAPEEIVGGFGNDSLSIEDMHVYIENGFTKLNETMGKRFDELDNSTGDVRNNLDTISESVIEINNTLMNSITDQNVMQDGIAYLRGMVDYLSEKQDEMMSDVSFLKGQTRHNNIIPGPGVDQVTRISDGPKCQTTTSDKTGSIDLKAEFDKISEKLDIIDNRSEELNDNFVYTSEILEASRNNTQHVVKLVEALSGSTIWIPHILREVKMTAKSLNESINATYLVYRQILGRRSDTPPSDHLPCDDDSKLKKSENYQNGAPELQCKINDEDRKLMRYQISRVEEILEKLKNTTTPKTEPKLKKSQPNPILLRKKEVRGNSTSGILSIQSPQGWLHVCYDESQSNLVSNIACLQLGFSLGTPLIVPNLLGPTEKAFLINCLQKESNLDFCHHQMVSSDHCKDKGLLGVFCVE